MKSALTNLADNTTEMDLPCVVAEFLRAKKRSHFVNGKLILPPNTNTYESVTKHKHVA